MIRWLSVFGAWIALAASLCAAELPFPVGEELVYKISWNGIPIAWSRAVTQMDTYEGRDVLAMRITVNTYPFFDHICKVDDFYEGLIDPKTFLPIRFEQKLQQRNYRKHDVTTFNYETLSAHYSRIPNKGKTKNYPIESDSRDILSFMYFMRSVLLEEDAKTHYRVMSDEKIYDLFLTTFKTDPIDLPYYEKAVPSLELKPEAMFDGLFVRKGKATVWVSRDPRHLLTYAKVSTPFGRVSLTLQTVSGPGDDFWIKEKKDGDGTEQQ
jgi:hypothetical protein